MAFALPAIEDFEFTVRFPGQHEAERKVELQSEQNSDVSLLEKIHQGTCKLGALGMLDFWLPVVKGAAGCVCLN